MQRTYAPRLTLSIGPTLRGLLESGQCRGSSLPERLDTLAGRYTALVESAVPPFRPAQWAAIARYAATIDLRHPAAHLTLSAVLRSDKSDARFGYSVESLQPVQLYGMICVAERLLALDPPFDTLDEAALAAQLEAWHISLAKLTP